MRNNVAGIISSIGTYEEYKKVKCPIVGVDRVRNSFEYSPYSMMRKMEEDWLLRLL